MYEYIASLVKDLDGDTADVLIDLGFKINHEVRIRFSAINAPETKTPEGIVSKQFVLDWFAKNPKFIVRTEKVIKTGDDKKDEYGRYLGYFFTLDGKECLNKLLLDNGLAKIY